MPAAGAIHPGGRVGQIRMVIAVNLYARCVESEETFEGTPCWLFTGALGNGGYAPQLRIGDRRVLAHRASYEDMVGPIPVGLALDHLCRVRNCVNPYHLDPVTQAVNNRRSTSGEYWAGKTHCPTGHGYTEANTYRHGGKRQCRACRHYRDTKAA